MNNYLDELKMETIICDLWDFFQNLCSNYDRRVHGERDDQYLFLLIEIIQIIWDCFEKYDFDKVMLDLKYELCECFENQCPNYKFVDPIYGERGYLYKFKLRDIISNSLNLKN